MAPLSNTVSASYFSIAFIRYMTESDLGGLYFALVSITAGSLCGRGGSKQEAPCQDQEAENLPLSHKHKESKLDVGLGKELPKHLSEQHQHQKQMPEFKMPDSVGDISNPCTMSPRPFRVNIIPSHVDFTGG